MKKAFTLIELLVVIAIIAILAAILFPVFAQAKVAAKKTQSLMNLKQSGTAVNIYLADSDDLFPLAFHPSDPAGGYNWNRFIPVPASQLPATDPAWKRDAAATFVFNSMQPYMKNTQILQCPSGQVINTSGTYGPATQPTGLVSPTYTYNGNLNGYASTAVAAISQQILFWHGHGRRSLYGYGYASPWLQCNDANSPCIYSPASAAGCSTANGGTSGYTTNTTLTGVDAFNGGIVMVATDSSARYLKLSLGTTAATARTDPRRDPWGKYGSRAMPCGRWFYGGGGGCHPYMFRPDWDFTTNDPAVYVDGSVASQAPYCQ
ncbi:MAG: prepilin-type N-terminal cleavage/methylation domain-containing protein [Chthonomonas sp.]|nr:prepilin-type N-terminal cleavage/methylation domain-containing protein [Chthonomonas sp.]